MNTQITWAMRPKTVNVILAKTSATWLLPLLLVFALPAVGHAQFTFTTNSGTITITGYNGPGGTVVIPDTTNGYPVTSIGPQAFYLCSNLTQISIPESVNTIDGYSFSYCENLQTIFLPDTITNIAEGAFAGCSRLKNITLPTNLTSIASVTFIYCTNLTIMAVPDGVTSIGASAFDHCNSLRTVTIYGSVTNIGDYAFFYCSRLTGVYFQGNAPQVGTHVYDNATNVINYYLPGTSGWGSTLGGRFAAYWQVYGSYSTNNATITIYKWSDWSFNPSVSIPGKINGFPVATIGGGAFESCRNVTDVTLPNSVTSIEGGAFSDCTGLAELMVPNSVTNIGYEAFYHCTNLSSISIAKNVKRLGGYAFWFCTSLQNIAVDPLNPCYSSLDGVLFDKSQTDLLAYPGGRAGAYVTPNTVTYIGGTAFSHGALASLTISDGVTNIGTYAISFCMNLTNFTIGTGLRSFYLYAFYRCDSLQAITVKPSNSVYSSSADGVLFDKNQTILITYPAGKTGAYTIPSSVTSIGDYAFDRCCNLPSITIPFSVTNIGASAFGWCTSLTRVTIPESVIGIGSTAFQYCSGLTNITVGSSVAFIGDFAFLNDTNLTLAYFKGNAPSLGSNVFYNATNATVYYLPGTTGWDPTFGGLPTVPWNPQMSSSSADFGVRTNCFGFTIAGSSNLVVVVEACTNLTCPDWLPVGTNTLTGGSSYFTDSQWTNYPGRFYRFRSP